MAAQSSGKKQMNHSDSDGNDELFLPPSSTLSFHHAHLQNSDVINHPPTTLRSFSSEVENEDDDCFQKVPVAEDCYAAGAAAPEPNDVNLNKKTSLKREDSIASQSQCSDMETSSLSPHHRSRLMRQGSIVDGLLHEIYDHWHGSRRDSFDSDTLTECSSTSELMWCSRHDISMYTLEGGYQSSIERRQTGSYTRSFLQTQDPSQLSRMLTTIQRLTTVMSARLVRQLKRRDRRLAKRKRNYDVITAILQAASLKRQIDTRMRFSIQPPHGQPSAFDQWKDAMRAVCRLPMGIPTEFRKKVWLSLADHYLLQLRINWDKTLRFVFNERSNPDDDKLGMQIVKDLHRTGCSNFSGDDNVEDRAILKRVLLAYARWNKRVGYCQGFNVIAALLLNVMDRKEDDALKVMIYLIDSVLPESYFANNLRALSVDMAVFRDLLALTYPRLSKHLDRLQLQAQDVRTGACYEPPLTNVFTMQWFLTLFATCLPVNVVLRAWDSVLLEGSEILLRTALTIWGKLSKRILSVSSADEFYSVMGELSTSIMQGTVLDGDSIIKSIYALGDFPFPHLNELREKYTYNIRPLTPATSSGVRKVGGRSLIKAMLYSDDDDMDDDDVTAMACMPGEMSASSSDISVLGPGVYSSGLDPAGGGRGGGGDMQMERMSTDINSLKLQYQRLKERQQQAHIIIAAASQKKAQLISSSPSSSTSKKPLLSPSSSSSPRGRATPSIPSPILLPSIESPTAMNHLFVGKNKPPSASAKNRLVTQGPRISQYALHTTGSSGVLSKQLQAVANAQAVSKSQRMRSSSRLNHNNKQPVNVQQQSYSTNTAITATSTSPRKNMSDNTSTPQITDSNNGEILSTSQIVKSDDSTLQDINLSQTTDHGTSTNSGIASIEQQDTNACGIPLTPSNSKENSDSCLVVEQCDSKVNIGGENSTDNILNLNSNNGPSNSGCCSTSDGSGCDKETTSRDCPNVDKTSISNLSCPAAVTVNNYSSHETTEENSKNRSTSVDNTNTVPIPRVSIEDVSNSKSSDNNITHSEFQNLIQLEFSDAVPKWGSSEMKGDLDTSSISDKSVQTSFELSDNFDDVIQEQEVDDNCYVIQEQEVDSDSRIKNDDDANSNISRGCHGGESLPTMQWDLSDTSLRSSCNTNTETALQVPRVMHHHHDDDTVPYNTDNMDYTPPIIPDMEQCVIVGGVSSSPSKQTTCHKNNDHTTNIPIPSNLDRDGTYLVDNNGSDEFTNSISTNPHHIGNHDNTNPNHPPYLNPKPQEDSGIDSSSTASPSTTPRRRPKDNSHGIIHDASQEISPLDDEKDTMIFVTQHQMSDEGVILSSTPSLTIQIENNNDVRCIDEDKTINSNTKETNDKANYDGCFIKTDEDTSVLSNTVNESSNIKTNVASYSDPTSPTTIKAIDGNISNTNTNTFIDVTETESINTTIDVAMCNHESATTTTTDTITTDESAATSTTTATNIITTTDELAMLSNMVTTPTSPQRKYFHRSVSCSVSSPGLIETVPVPENMTMTSMTVSTDNNTVECHHQHTHSTQKQNFSGNENCPQKQNSGELELTAALGRKYKVKRNSKQGIGQNNWSGKDVTGTTPITLSPKPSDNNTTTTKSSNPAYSRRFSMPAPQTPASGHMTSNESSSVRKPFNPFPVKLFNANRAKTGLKLGLYSPTTLKQLNKGFNKPRTTST